MRKINYFIALYWIVLLLIPMIILVSKLCYWLYTNEFQEWWVTIMWAFILPITTLSIVLLKGSKISNIDK